MGNSVDVLIIFLSPIPRREKSFGEAMSGFSSRGKCSSFSFPTSPWEAGKEKEGLGKLEGGNIEEIKVRWVLRPVTSC